jgi:carbamoyl-phosphate synthase large subunit
LPWASDPKFIEKIGGLCRELKIDLLIPGVDEELLVLAQSAEALAPTRLLLPKADYVEAMLDKLHMVRALSAKKIQVPFTKTLEDDLVGFSFPCISKPRCGRGSRDVRELSSIRDAISLKTALGSFARQMLMQEKIKGIEYTVQMIADAHGRLCAVVPVRIEIKRGITLRAETEAEPRVISACREIHRAVSTGGCYNIQLILTPEGGVFPFEINPRVSTTLCLVVAAGVDPVAVFLGQVQGDGLLPFAAGIQLRRHWANHFIKDTNES